MPCTRAAQTPELPSQEGQSEPTLPAPQVLDPPSAGDTPAVPASKGKDPMARKD